MKQLTEKELKENYDKFIKVLNKYFTGERLEQLNHMYSMGELGENLMLSPASSVAHFHNAYPGGYIDHIFNVCRNSFKVKDLFIAMGGKIDFTDEEMVFSALHHDLGKIGYKGELHYVLNDSEWHIKNRGEIFKTNKTSQYTDITDKSLFILQSYGIKCSHIEYLTIKLTDGMYADANKDYLKQFDADKQLKYTLPRILHWADHMSTVIERQNVIK